MTPDRIVGAVARALLESDIPGEDWDALEFAEPLQRADYLKQAQAAITGHLKVLADQGMVVMPRDLRHDFVVDALWNAEGVRGISPFKAMAVWAALQNAVTAHEQSTTDEEVSGR